jgi:PAS domain S-box-containing protein
MQDEHGAAAHAAIVTTTAEALWNATERLRAMEEAAPAGIVAFDLEGRVTIWNRAAEELFGWGRPEVVGRVYPLNANDQQAEHTALVARVLTGESLSGIETSKLRKDRTVVSISLSCGPIRDAAGRVCGTMQVLTDISEAKRLQRQFLQAQKMEAFGQLAGGVAHDFNNLLTVIMGFSELLTEPLQQNPAALSALEEITKAGERASQLTRQLLAFSRKQIWVLQVLDLNDVIAHFKKMLSRIVREDIRLEITAQGELEHTKADPGQIEQLLMNLVVNARDAMPKGGTLTIATANARLDAEFAQQHGAAPGRYVSLTVQDTGVGMTPDVRACVFEPFFTTKGAGKGTGLGLSTVAGLAEQSGGFVTLDSTPGIGTTVTTYWPAVDGTIEPAAADSPATTLEGTETILLVEDETGVRQLIGKVLERYGYKVLPARDAEHAIAIEAGYEDPIALLVSDLIMPGLNGPELAQRIVQRRPDIKVLFVSGYASRQAVELSLTTRNASFLSKPFTPEKLARKVRERLDRAALPEPTADPE